MPPQAVAITTRKQANNTAPCQRRRRGRKTTPRTTEDIGQPSDLARLSTRLIVLNPQLIARGRAQIQLKTTVCYLIEGLQALSGVMKLYPGRCRKANTNSKPTPLFDPRLGDKDKYFRRCIASAY